MKASVLVALSAFGIIPCVGFAASDRARWEQRARNVEILRDTWGIAHVFGATDADAVFGFIYAQAEDDFPRIELKRPSPPISRTTGRSSGRSMADG